MCIKTIWKRFAIGFGVAVSLAAATGTLGLAEDSIEMISPSGFMGWFNAPFVIELVVEYQLDSPAECGGASPQNYVELWAYGPRSHLGDQWGEVVYLGPDPCAGTISRSIHIDSWGEGLIDVRSRLKGFVSPSGGACCGYDESFADFSYGIDYTEPVIEITVPQVGAKYALGEEVLADFTAEDPPGWKIANGWYWLSGLDKVTSTVPNGQPLDTSQLGAHAFTVTATDNAGNRTTATVNYSVVAVPITIVPTGDAGPEAFLDTVIEVPEDEDPPMAGDLPLVATHAVGDVITGSCQVLYEPGYPIGGSFVHVYVYSVDIDALPEVLELLNHWMAPYSVTEREYQIAWETEDLAPGYYDLVLYFEDASTVTFRIQLT